MDIDDSLFIAVKEAAVRRRTTMKSIIEHALRREVDPESDLAVGEFAACYKTGKHGLPLLNKSTTEEVSSDVIYQMMEDEGI